MTQVKRPNNNIDPRETQDENVEFRFQLENLILKNSFANFGTTTTKDFYVRPELRADPLVSPPAGWYKLDFAKTALTTAQLGLIENNDEVEITEVSRPVTTTTTAPVTDTRVSLGSLRYTARQISSSTDANRFTTGNLRRTGNSSDLNRNRSYADDGIFFLHNTGGTLFMRMGRNVLGDNNRVSNWQSGDMMTITRVSDNRTYTFTPTSVSHDGRWRILGGSGTVAAFATAFGYSVGSVAQNIPIPNNTLFTVRLFRRTTTTTNPLRTGQSHATDGINMQQNGANVDVRLGIGTMTSQQEQAILTSDTITITRGSDSSTLTGTVVSATYSAGNYIELKVAGTLSSTFASLTQNEAFFFGDNIHRNTNNHNNTGCAS